MLFKTKKENPYKKEQTDLISARVKALQEEIDVMEKRMKFFTIVAPISGRFVRSAGTDTLATIQDTSRFIVVMPIKWKDRNYLKAKQEVTVKVEGMTINPEGTVVYINNNIIAINGSHLMRVAAVINNGEKDLEPGLIAQCKLKCSSLRLAEHIFNYFR